MRFSGKIQKCGLSPIRKFHPYAVAAEAQGKTIYHLNIGQPDVLTPPAFFEAIRRFEQPVLEYAPSPGVPALIDAIRDYYEKLGIRFDAEQILVTAGGSEALAITLQCILDEGDEILIPEPFYPNYNTMTRRRRAITMPCASKSSARSTGAPARCSSRIPATPPARCSRTRRCA